MKVSVISKPVVQQYTNHDGAGLNDEEGIWLGIDQSLTGFAVCALDSFDHYEIGVLQSKARGAERLFEIKQYLQLVLKGWNYDDVAMEGTVVHSASASVLGELAGVVKVTLFEHAHQPLIVPPLTLKKFVIGNAKSSQKSHMLLAAYKRYGVDIPNDNAIDAYGIARIVRGVPQGAVEKSVIEKLSDPKFRE
jgi:Holliday junction resolvasome RuvABC endonuclease subunit